MVLWRSRAARSGSSTISGQQTRRDLDVIYKVFGLRHSAGCRIVVDDRRPRRQVAMPFAVQLVDFKVFSLCFITAKYREQSAEALP